MSNTNYAVLDSSNVVTNIIVLNKDNEESFAEITGWTLIFLGDPDSSDYVMCQIGWVYSPTTKTFSAAD